MTLLALAVIGWVNYPAGCQPIDAGEIFSVPALEIFALMSTGESIPWSRVRTSGDGGYHLCIGRNGYWLLAPPGARS